MRFPLLVPLSRDMFSHSFLESRSVFFKLFPKRHVFFKKSRGRRRDEARLLVRAAKKKKKTGNSRRADWEQASVCCFGGGATVLRWWREVGWKEGGSGRLGFWEQN